MKLTDRVKGILLNPKTEWPAIGQESTTIADLYKGYVIPLAAIGPVASIIGMSLVGLSLPLMGTYRLPLATAISSAVVQYILTLVAVYVLALVIDALAPTFSGEKDVVQSFKVAAYSYTPGWLVGIFMLIPNLSILSILGLYGLYILYIGLPILKKSPQDKSLGYTVAVIVVAVIIFIIIGIISRSFITYPTPNFPMKGI